MIAWFADDALVNDTRRESRGVDAIRRWLDREIIGDRVTMQVTAASEHHGDVALVAVMDGDYDKAGLPDPLVLTYYFTVRDDRIVRLNGPRCKVRWPQKLRESCMSTSQPAPGLKVGQRHRPQRPQEAVLQSLVSITLAGASSFWQTPSAP